MEYTEENLKNFIENAKNNPVNTQRSLYWQFILYLDSFDSDFEDILQKYNLRYYYCVHDKDLNEQDLKLGLPEDECRLKKPHIHITLLFETLKGVNQVAPYVLECGGCFVLKVGNIRHNFRYLIHKDNPEKYQYREDNIIEYGIDLKRYLYDDDIDKSFEVSEMQRFIRQNSFRYLSDFMDYTLENNANWHYILMDDRNVRQYIFDYIKSRSYKLSEDNR